MVEQSLTTAANELAGEFSQLDPVSVATTGLGIGVGLFSGEFVAEIAGNMFGGNSSRRRAAVEVLSKFVTSGAFVALRSFVGGQMLGVLSILAAAGAAASAVLQVVEVAISAVQTGEVTAGQTLDGNLNVDTDFNTSTNSGGGASGGQVEGETFAAT